MIQTIEAPWREGDEAWVKVKLFEPRIDEPNCWWLVNGGDVHESDLHRAPSISADDLAKIKQAFQWAQQYVDLHRDEKHDANVASDAIWNALEILRKIGG